MAVIRTMNELDSAMRLHGAHDWNRTNDLLLTKEVLYRLSYGGIKLFLLILDVLVAYKF